MFFQLCLPYVFNLFIQFNLQWFPPHSLRTTAVHSHKSWKLLSILLENPSESSGRVLLEGNISRVVKTAEI